jgi:hypothetical protein
MWQGRKVKILRMRIRTKNKILSSHQKKSLKLLKKV